MMFLYLVLRGILSTLAHFSYHLFSSLLDGLRFLLLRRFLHRDSRPRRATPTRGKFRDASSTRALVRLRLRDAALLQQLVNELSNRPERAREKLGSRFRVPHELLANLEVELFEQVFLILFI